MLRPLLIFALFLFAAAGNLSAQVSSPEIQTQADELAWRKVNTGQSKVVYNLDFISDSVIWARTPDFLMRSSDLGETWEHVVAPAGNDSVMYSQFLTDSIGYCSIVTSHWLHRTTDAGKTWTARHTMMGGEPWGFRMFDTTNGIVWNPTQSAQTQDAGRTWFVLGHIDITDMSFADRKHGFIVGHKYPWDLDLPEKPIAAHFARTTDAGRSWKAVCPRIDEDWYGVVALDSQNLVVEGNTIYWSSNAGDSWNPASGMEGLIIGLNFRDRYNGYASGRSGTMHRTTDGGHSWTRMISPTSAHIGGIYFLDSLTGFISALDGLYKTTTGGTSWVSILRTAPIEITVYPNPATELIRLRFTLEAAQAIQIKIIDVDGTEASAVIEKLFDRGEHVIVVPIPHLLSGSYRIWLQGEKYVGSAAFNIVR